MGLRLAGYGYQTSFFNRASVQGRDCLVANDKFGLRFFAPELARTPTPVVIDAVKKPGTIRIFLFGESAALGDPRPAFGMGRYLEVLLQERYPEARIEVVCVAMTAINSHAILPIARECARLQGDLWVVYMGNNEMIGPFGPATVFGRGVPGLAAIRLGLTIKQTRIGQWIDSLAQRVRGTDSKRGSWAGIQMFLEQQLAPDDPRRGIVHKHFARNLEDILRVAERAGCPVILSTVASNLRDCSPLASLHSIACDKKARAECDLLESAAVTNQAAGDVASALKSLENAHAIDPGFARVQFRLGLCQLALGNRTAATEAFRQARDCDALPFRADSAVNTCVREAAARHGSKNARLLDAEEVLRARSSDGVIGAESFFEHVHLTFAGNYTVARALAEMIASQLPEQRTGPHTDNWASQEVCERRLGLTDWNRIGVLELVVKRIDAPPFTSQIDHTNQIERWLRHLNTLRAGLTPERKVAARDIHRQALLHRPTDHYLYENYAEFLEATGDIDEAIAQWEAVRMMLPHHFVAYVHAGRLMARRQQLSSAEERLRRALELEPRSSEAHIELGRVLTSRGKFEEALAQYQEALRRQPNNAAVYFWMADTLARNGNRPAATDALVKAIELQPSYWEAHYLLGVELAMSNRVAEAQQHFEATIRLRPNYALAHLNLGVALARQGHLEAARLRFQETLKLDPENQKARELLETIESATRRRSPLLP